MSKEFKKEVDIKKESQEFVSENQKKVEKQFDSKDNKEFVKLQKKVVKMMKFMVLEMVQFM